MNDIITQLIETSIQSEFESLINQHLPDTFPALSICVIKDDKIVLNNGWGWISPQQQDYPVTHTSYFDLASVTKLFVETAFLTFVSDGKVTLDTPVVDIIPEFGHINPRTIDGGQDPFTKEQLPIDPQFKDKLIDVRAVTFQHLVTHTSGLPPWRDVYRQADHNPPPSPRANGQLERHRWKNALRAIVSYPFVGTIGDTVRYSDIGIMLLGEAVARLNQTSLDRAVDDLVCEPLNLTSIVYNPVTNGIPLSQIIPTEIDNQWRNRRIWGEVHDENACGIGGISGHAGLFANAYDIAKFGQAWLSDNGKLGISTELKNLATQEHANGQFRMGLGWMLKAQEGSSAGEYFSEYSYGHTGFTGTSLWIDPQQHIVCVILTNRVYHGRNPEGIHKFRRACHDLIFKGIQQL